MEVVSNAKDYSYINFILGKKLQSKMQQYVSLNIRWNCFTVCTKGGRLVSRNLILNQGKK